MERSVVERKLKEKTSALADAENFAHRTMGVYNSTELNTLRIQVELLKELKNEIDRVPVGA